MISGTSQDVQNQIDILNLQKAQSDANHALTQAQLDRQIAFLSTNLETVKSAEQAVADVTPT